MRPIAIAVFLLLTFPVAAVGSGLDLTWSACATDGGDAHIEFPCDCPSLPVPMIGSFTSNNDMADFVAADFTIEFQATASELPDFWSFNSLASPTACNTGIVFGDERPSVGCAGSANPWGDVPPGGASDVAFVFQEHPYGILNRGRFLCTVFRPGSPTALASGVPTFGFRFDFYADLATENGGPCGGCTTPMEFRFILAVLRSQSGLDEVIENPGTFGQIVYASPGGRQIVCLPTPARPQTWGMLKSLYR